MTAATPPSRRGAYVRLTEDAIDDLHRLMKKDPQIVRWCFKKMLLLERDPMAGEALLGGLVGFRKLVVNDRHWRIVWRVLEDEAGGTVVDIAEVWAAGVRSDGDVYAEMLARVTALGDDVPAAKALLDVVPRMGHLFEDVAPRPEPAPDRTTGTAPPWLVDNLVRTLGMNPIEAGAMTPEDAMAALQEFWERGGQR